MYAKFVSPVSSSRKVLILDQSQNEIAEGEVTHTNEWIKINSKNDLAGMNTAGVLTITTPDYTGNIIIDHFLIIEKNQADQCQRTILLTYI